MPPALLKCPRLGHQTLETSLPSIIIGDADPPAQISKIVIPRSGEIAYLNIQHLPTPYSLTSIDKSCMA